MEVLDFEIVLEAVRDVHELDEKAKSLEYRNYQHASAPFYTAKARWSFSMNVMSMLMLSFALVSF